MSANIEQIKAMLERTEKTNVIQKQKADLDKEQLQLKATYLQQKQFDEELAEAVKMEWDSFNKHIAEYGVESEDVVWLNWLSFVDIATYFYELGQREMRNRITNPEYNKQVVDKIKSEHPIAATEEELKKAMKERYPMPEDADAHTRDRIAAARNGFLSGYSYELDRNIKK